MRRGAATGLTFLLCLAGPVAGADARVLEVGTVIDDHPKTVAAGTTVMAPKRLVLDVAPRPSAPVAVEWFVLCSDSPGPVGGDEFVARRPVHRRLQLPKGPRGLCVIDITAKYVEAAQKGRIALRLRGQAREVPGLARPGTGG
ncbi:MAG TPA: hypothetical protein VIT85_04320 [Solirubrobacterales bacterium]